MKEKINWGILATGGIAAAMAKGLALVPDAHLAAVGSRTQKAADQFGLRFGIPKRYGSYEDLARDPEIDVVYVSTPHNLHYENCLMLINEGKDVLCEKPFTINAVQAAEVIALAREKKRFVLEAMWTRFLPAIVKVREILREGHLGEIRMFNASFGFKAAFDPLHRLFNPSLGGGALLDVGVYPVSFASMVFGEPSQISSQCFLGKTGVDEQAAVLFRYGRGQMAVLAAAVRTEIPQDAYIIGTEGTLCIHAPWWQSRKLSLRIGKREKVFVVPFKGNGFSFEAEEVMRCLREGRLESDILPLDETLAIMKTMDFIRSQWGLKYPME
ncbi:MAG: Gfo/Idh/MocA family oxidoreductase [Candidatus Aminicenantes bacterium]|nr:Gfo/Idh/MocA family oxidoreductase [Candidatus Aminicenantes bacterium]